MYWPQVWGTIFLRIWILVLWLQRLLLFFHLMFLGCIFRLWPRSSTRAWLGITQCNTRLFWVSNLHLDFSGASRFQYLCLSYTSPVTGVSQLPKHLFSWATKYKAKDCRVILCHSGRPHPPLPGGKGQLPGLPESSPLPPHLGRIVLLGLGFLCFSLEMTSR